MARLLLARLLGAAILIVAVSVLAFLLVRGLPGDAAQARLGLRATPEEVTRLRAELGLDRPLPVQYLSWAADALRLDFGTSMGSHGGAPVSRLLLQGLAVTATLTGLGTLLAVLIGLPMGLAAGARAGSALDRAISTASVVGLSLPPFYLAYLLILVFAVWLGVLPSVGYAAPGEDLGAFLRLMVLPVLTIGLINAAPIARTARAAAVEVASQGHIRLQRLNGLPSSVIWGKHVLRGAMIPVVTVIGLQIGYLLGGVIVIENMFALPGIGRQMLIAVEQRDYNTLQAIMVLFAALFVGVNLVVDLLYAVIDPRVRAS